MNNLRTMIHFRAIFLRIFLYIFFYFFLQIIFLSNIFAQKKGSPLPPKDTEGYVSVGIMAQGFQYFGDVYSNSIQFMRPGIGAYIARKISPKMQVRLAVSVGSIAGNDASASEGSAIYARNLHFRNPLQELSTVFTWDILANYGKHKKRRTFTPYLLGGIALLHHNPQAKLPEAMGGNWVDLQALGTEGQSRPSYQTPYNRMQIVFPYGLGFRIKTDDRWDISLEFAPRLTFTDYLDDVGGKYPNLADLGNPLASALSNRTAEATEAVSGKKRNMQLLAQNFGEVITYMGTDGIIYKTLPDFGSTAQNRGNPKSNDMYVVINFTVGYIINVGLKCPQFR